MPNIYVRKFIDFDWSFLVDFLDERLNSKRGRWCDKAQIQNPFRYMGNKYLLIVHDKNSKVILLVPADDPYKIILLDLGMEDEILKILGKFKSGADILVEALH